MSSGFKYAAKPSPPKPRQSRAEAALEAQMARRFRENFNQMFPRWRPPSAPAVIDAAPAKEITVKKLAADRQCDRTELLRRSRAVLDVSDSPAEQVLKFDAALDDILDRLDALESQRLLYERQPEMSAVELAKFREN
jgi:hypothetical protein